MRHAGIDLFIQDGAYTTVTAAVAMLMALALMFSAVSAIWSMSRAGDIQVSADVTALAGANVVSSYHTVATVLDASILSLGLSGFAIAGAGLVATLVPGAQSAAAQMVDAGVQTLKVRNEFAESASGGLDALEESLPFLVAANAMRACGAQSGDTADYTGTAFALPRESASSFPALQDGGIKTDGLEEAAGDLGDASRDLMRASEESERAKREAWLADCGGDGPNMQERAAALTGLSASLNPDYDSSITWEPSVALERARAYYRWRRDHNVAEGPGDEAQADAAARQAFYAYACRVLEEASISEADGQLKTTVPLLPKNADEVRQTELYTEAIWPSSLEPDGATLHYGASCLGAKGSPGPRVSLRAIDDGVARECPVCRFSVGDVGKVPAASTSIDNGFEYHLRAFTQALDKYTEARNRELELQRAADGEARSAGHAFEQALGALAGKRPRIAPPGRAGCVALVVAGELEGPADLGSAFSAQPQVAARGAISAATLAPDAATRESNVLGSFFSSLEAASPGGATGLLGKVMDLWGSLLTGYGDLTGRLDGLMDDILGGLGSVGLGPVAEWLSNKVDAAVRGLGFEPVDLSLRKPVLTDSSNVLAADDTGGLADIQGALRSLPVGTTDPAALMRAIGYRVGEYVRGLEFTVAEIPLPGGGSIPLTVRVRDLLGART